MRFKFVNKLNPVLRWILFVPLSVLSFSLLNFIANISLMRYIGPRDHNTITQLIYLVQEFLVIYFSLLIGYHVMPKGKIIAASIVLGVFIFLSGLNIALILTGNIDDDVLGVITASAGLVIASLIALITQVIEKTKQT